MGQEDFSIIPSIFYAKTEISQSCVYARVLLYGYEDPYGSNNKILNA